METGIYDKNDNGFIYAIQKCIADVCDSTAALQTVLGRNLNDSMGNFVYDMAAAEKFQNFVFDLNRLYRYSKEIMPLSLANRVETYVSDANISDVPNPDSVINGIKLADDLQQFVHGLGLKNTSIVIEIFDFEYYYNSKIEEDKKYSEFEEIEDGEFSPIDDGIDIVGFPQKSEFSFMFSNYSNRTFYLLSLGKVEEAMAFFYNALGDFAPVFDEVFLKNCIDVTNNFFEDGGKKRDVLSKNEYFKMYQLHKAQFSRLLVRAHVLLQPDIIDNRFPNYEPAQVPGGI